MEEKTDRKKMLEEALTSQAGKKILERIVESRTVADCQDFVAVGEDLLDRCPELYLSVIGIWSDEDQARLGLSEVIPDEVMYKVPGRYLFALSATKEGAKQMLQRMRHSLDDGFLRSADELIVSLEVETSGPLETYLSYGSWNRDKIVEFIHKHSVREFCEDEPWGIVRKEYQRRDHRITGTHDNPSFRGIGYEVGYVVTKRGHISHGA